MSMKMAVLWVVAPCTLHHRPDDGGGKYLCNVDKLLPDDTAQQPRRQPSTCLILITEMSLTHSPSRYYCYLQTMHIHCGCFTLGLRIFLTVSGTCTEIIQKEKISVNWRLCKIDELI
jgi:hypothetical protein